MAVRVSHGACGKSWLQRGNRTGHCSKCHETFEGVALFDAHQSLDDAGRVICADPRTMTFRKQPLRRTGDSWSGPALPEGTFTKGGGEDPVVQDR